MGPSPPPPLVLCTVGTFVSPPLAGCPVAELDSTVEGALVLLPPPVAGDSEAPPDVVELGATLSFKMFLTVGLAVVSPPCPSGARLKLGDEVPAVGLPGVGVFVGTLPSIFVGAMVKDVLAGAVVGVIPVVTGALDDPLGAEGVKDTRTGAVVGVIPVDTGTLDDPLGREGNGVSTLAVVGSVVPRTNVGIGALVLFSVLRDGVNVYIGRSRVGNTVKVGPFGVVGDNEMIGCVGVSVSMACVGCGADGPCVSDWMGLEVGRRVASGTGEGLGLGRDFEL